MLEYRFCHKTKLWQIFRQTRFTPFGLSGWVSCLSSARILMDIAQRAGIISTIKIPEACSGRQSKTEPEINP